MSPYLELERRQALFKFRLFDRELRRTLATSPGSDFDAELRFGVGDRPASESGLCRSGEVLQGLIRPDECEAFDKECTPRTPLGATMVSSEGACAAYHQYRRLDGVSVSL